MIRLFVGLGNPGAAYEATRHNAGFWWVDALAEQWNVRLAHDKSFQAEIGHAQFGGQKRWLLKPQTFMNLSGQSVAALARFYKIPPEQILVAHDELDIEAGQAKLKFGGGHAGHNGLRDIHTQLGTDQYWRLRLGIGHPGVKAEVVHWVLKKPSPDDRAGIAQAIDRSIKAAHHLIAGNMSEATKTIHTLVPVTAPSAKNVGDPGATTPKTGSAPAQSDT